MFLRHFENKVGVPVAKCNKETQLKVKKLGDKVARHASI
jgi:hypothetical protein